MISPYYDLQIMKLLDLVKRNLYHCILGYTHYFNRFFIERQFFQYVSNY